MLYRIYSLFLSLQLFFKALSGGVYAAFYRSQRKGELLGYFVVFIAGDVQAEGRTKVGGQLLYHPAQFFVFYGAIAIAVIATHYLLFGVCIALFALMRIEVSIAHNGAQPPCKVVVLSVQRSAMHRLEQGLLYKILGGGPIGRKPRCIPAQQGDDLNQPTVEFCTFHYTRTAVRYC